MFHATLGMYSIYGLLKLVAWLKYELFCFFFLSLLQDSIPLSDAVPVPSFGYPVPPLEPPFLLPVSPPPVTCKQEHTC